MTRNQKLQIAAIVIAMAAGFFVVKCYAQDNYNLRNYEGAGRTENLPYLGEGRTTEYLGNRARMAEAVREMGFSERDQDAIVGHVIDQNGSMNIEQLRESDMSDDAYYQYMDDARTW